MAQYKAQHYIPVVYQSAFADPESIGSEHITPFVWRLNVKTGEISKRAPKNMFSESYLYSQYDSSGNRRDDVEKYLGTLETGYSRFRRKFEQAILQSDEVFLNQKMTGSDRLWLCRFIFWQFKRSKHVLADIHERLKEEVNNMDMPPEARLKINEPEIMQTGTIQIIRLVGEGQERNLIKTLMERQITIMLIPNPETSLVTSDNATFFFNPDHSGGLSDPNTEIGMPFTPRMVIGIKHLGSKITILHLKEKSKVRFWNMQTVRNAKEFVIGTNKAQLERLYRGLTSA